MTFRASLPGIAKRAVWNLKYGALAYRLSSAADEMVHYLCDRVSNSSSILDLGCGRGSLLVALREAEWTGHYCGVDISRLALEGAHKLSDQRSSWIVSDIEGFEPQFRYDAIVMNESIYYVNQSRLREVLACLQRALTDSGFLLIRIHDVQKHREYVDAINLLLPNNERVGEGMFVFS